MSGAKRFDKLTLLECQSLTARLHPDWPDAAVQEQARKTHERQVVVARAYFAGLRREPEIRERLRYGVGLDWPELHKLMPEERTFVLGAVRAKFSTARPN